MKKKCAHFTHFEQNNTHINGCKMMHLCTIATGLSVFFKKFLSLKRCSINPIFADDDIWSTRNCGMSAILYQEDIIILSMHCFWEFSLQRRTT